MLVNKIDLIRVQFTKFLFPAGLYPLLMPRLMPICLSLHFLSPCIQLRCLLLHHIFTTTLYLLFACVCVRISIRKLQLLLQLWIESHPCGLFLLTNLAIVSAEPRRTTVHIIINIQTLSLEHCITCVI